MRAHRIDENHVAIVKALRKIGATVQSLAEVGKGCPDVLVGFRNVTYLLEIKSSHGQATPDQTRWWAAWRGLPVAVVHSPEEAITVVEGG